MENKSHQILVVDDEADIQRLFRQRFRQQILAEEYYFTFATSGAQALEMLKTEHSVDMVLTDIRMPEMDGFSLLEAINEIDENLQTVVVSAYGDFKSIRAAMNRGAFDFLTKPIDISDLKITIEKTLKNVERLRAQQQALQEAQQQITFLAFHDALTKLKNRAFLIDRLENVMKKSQSYKNYKYAFLFIDLDNFKMINDKLGHSVGDKVLQYVAHLLSKNARSSDTLARIGGDEFAILLEPVDSRAEIYTIAQCVYDSLSQEFFLNNHEIPLKVTIGITTDDVGYVRAEDVLRDADLAMYRAKENKQGFDFFEPNQQSAISGRLNVELDIRQAIREKQFVNYYQPIFSLATKELVGFEVLVRWLHSKKGLISPTEFMSTAEETYLINSIGWETMITAFNQVQNWRNAFPKKSLFLSINVSVAQIKQADFIGQVERMLDDYDLKNDGLLKLEITEDCLLENETVKYLMALQDSPIQLCIDNFGARCAPLSVLHDLPIDTLKLDQSLTQSVDESEEYNKMISIILYLAKNFGMDVIAEGIETEKKLAVLSDLGCQFGQGYFFAKPLELEQANALIAEQ